MTQAEVAVDVRQFGMAHERKLAYEDGMRRCQEVGQFLDEVVGRLADESGLHERGRQHEVRVCLASGVVGLCESRVPSVYRCRWCCYSSDAVVVVDCIVCGDYEVCRD